nr:transcriptional repressor ILP1 [Ipomoea batatas]
MSGKARNFRRRGGDDDDGDETPAVIAPNGNSTQSQAKPVASSGKPKKSSTLAPKSLLSFADDEESEDSPFTRPSRPSSSSSRLARPSSSHKLSSVIKGRSALAPSLPSNVQPQAGTYTKEALLELQKNTKTLAGSRPTQPKPKPKPESMEPVIVLKGLVKPAASVDPEMEKGRDSEDDEARVDRQGGSVGIDREDTVNRLNSMGLGKVLRATDDIGPEIPDQAMIDAIRAKRERLRQARAAAPDYIALDGGSNHGEADGLSDEEPEFQGRIGFFGEKIDSGKRGVFEDYEDKSGQKDVGDDSVYSEDEEDKIWEEEQVRKGLGKRMDDGSSRGVSSSGNGVNSIPVVQSVQQTKFGYPIAGASVYSSAQTVVAPVVSPITGAAGGWPGSNAISISQQAELAKKALHENVCRLEESHARTVASLSKTEENLSSSLSNVTTLENSLAAAGEKYIFMQNLRDFVSVICSFLQEKAPYIEELEDQMQKLHKARAEAILERRVANNEDEMRELEDAISAAKQVFSEHGSSAATIVAAKEAALRAAAEARRLRDLPVKLDEFGRDLNQQKRMDMARREKAREHRRAKSDTKRMSTIENDSSYQRVEGESSTDESDSESTAYRSNRDQLLQVAEEIFSDTNDEYSQLAVVVDKFERWKKGYSSSYRDAYMSLSIPAILSPYVRLELLKWDPLHKDADFMDMKWHSLLFNYGLPEHDSEFSSDDADANLIPQLVEKLAIPILHNHLAHCWDMLSTRETKYAVSAINLVFRYVPLSSSALGDLVAVLRNRLADAVAKLVVPKWDSILMKAVPNAARIAAYRFGMSVRLMRNICLWNNVLAMPVLEKLALDELLSGKILPHLRNIQSDIDDAITRTERIVASLYGVWAGPSVIGNHSPKLQPLVDYLLALSRMLEKKHLSTGAELETGKLARRLKKMLVELNEYDHAREISRTFNIKEAL